MDRLLTAFLGSDFAGAEVLGILVALLLLLALRLTLPGHARALGRLPLLLVIAHLATFAAGRALPEESGLRKILMPLSVLLLLVAIGRTGVLLVLDVILGRRLVRPLPRIIRDIVQGVVYAAIGLTSLRAAGVEPGSLLTTSALLTAVIGLSLQETLGNMFAGLAIQVQRPFEVGDWIAFDGELKNIGEVMEINWRATRVFTLDRVEVTVPNAALAKAPIRNFTKPTEVSRRSVYVTAPLHVPPADVHRVILEGIADTPGVVRDPAPSVVTNQFNEYGIEYWVRFFTDQFHRRDVVDGAVRDRIWYALRRARVEIPCPHRTIEVHQVTEESSARETERLLASRDQALRCVDILRVLSAEDIRRLAEMSELRMYAPGEVIVRQGDDSSELYIIERGEVRVTVRRQSGETELDVARLGAGKFFGEMALVTGDRRQATVRAATACELLAVGREAMQRILEKTPDVAERISAVLAERQAALDERASASQRLKDEGTLARQDQLLGRIRKFFSL